MAPERRDSSAETTRARRSGADADLDSGKVGDTGGGSGTGGGGGTDDRGDTGSRGSTDGRGGGTGAADGDWRDWTADDLARSAVAGIAAYLGGYALLYLWFLTQGRTASEAVDWQWVGWIFYHGQFVPLDVTAGTTSPGGAAVAEAGLGDASNVVPGFLLGTAAVAIAGFLLVRARAVVDPRGAAATGASLVLGYFPLAALGLLLFPGVLPNGIRVSPNPLWGFLITGLAVPILVGALGGLAFVAWRRRADEGADRPRGEESSETESPRARP